MRTIHRHYTRVYSCNLQEDIMVQRRKNRWRGTRRRTSNRQKGGLLPLAVTRKRRKKTTQIKRPPALTPKQLQFLRKTGPILGRAISSSEKIRKNVLGIS